MNIGEVDMFTKENEEKIRRFFPDYSEKTLENAFRAHLQLYVLLNGKDKMFNKAEFRKMAFEAFQKAMEKTETVLGEKGWTGI